VKRLIPIALIAVAAVAVIVASSGGSTKKGSAYSTTAASPAAAGKAGGATGAANSAIGTASSPLGKFLVDAKGRTLYLFEGDTKPNVSSCTTACLSIWPAYTTGGKAPAAKGGVAAAKLGMTARANGKSIVTYNGHPLYYYAGDSKPGATSGQGLDQFGGGWYVVTPAGDKIDEG
jgi:predicted lipoprotein with Yx(FWY)xxD motif